MKRQRPVRSCLQCRKRRLRCDQQHPACSRCAAAGTECTYDIRGEASSIDEPGASLQSSQAQAYSTDTISFSQDPIRHKEGTSDRERGQLFVQHGGRSSYIGPTFWANTIASESDPMSQRITHSLISRANNSFPNWFTPYEAVLGWESNSTTDPHHRTSRVSRIDPSRCKFCGRHYTLACILAYLPSRETCKHLCSLFFSTVFPLMPIFHLQGFAEDFRLFLEESETSRTHDSEISAIVRRKPGLVSLICSILFAALKCASTPRVQQVLGDDPDFTASNAYVLAVVSTILSGFPRHPSHYSLAAYLLTQTPFSTEEDFPYFPDFITTAFRVGLGMGLHRKISGSKFSIDELETRRRLWWYILHLDVMSSASSGLSPLFIDDNMANVEMISQHDQSRNDFVGSKPSPDARYIVATMRYEVSKAMRHVLRLHFENALQSPQQVYQVAEQLRPVTDRVNGTIKELLVQAGSVNPNRASLSSRPPLSGRPAEPESFARTWKVGTEDNPEQLDFCAWSAILLHLMTHKAFCVLYNALYRDPDMASDPQIRTSAVLHAQAFVQLFIRLCSDATSEPFRWMYPGIYQPLQAVSLLLADVLANPYSDEASLSRGLVDAVFDEYQVNEGLVGQSSKPQRQLSPAGQDAWIMLADARRKVLEHLGEDHHTLLPSRIPHSDVCICGQRFASSVQVDNNDGIRRNPQAESLDPSSQIFDPLNIQVEPLLPVAGQQDFNWQEWDTIMGNVPGFVS